VPSSHSKRPLKIVEVDLEGPKAGKVLVGIMATGICHTDAYTLDGFDSEASSRASSATKFGHRARGRPQRDRRKARRPRTTELGIKITPSSVLRKTEFVRRAGFCRISSRRQIPRYRRYW